MSALGQRVLVQHLTDHDSIAVVAEEGMPRDCLPSRDLREVYDWAIDYFHRGGADTAPSPDAMRERFGPDLFIEHEIDLDDIPPDTVEWALDDLRHDWLHAQAQHFVKSLSTEMAEASHEERLKVLHHSADELVSLLVSLERRSAQADVRERIEDRLLAHEARSRNAGFDGMSLGFPEVDEHTGGIHPGELAVIGAPPKTGKSYFAAHTAWKNWDEGNQCVVMFTLENSVEMSLDRIACIATGVDVVRWTRGECEEREVAVVRSYAERMENAPKPLWVLQPQPGRRSAEHMIREALLRGADQLIIDQLTFMEAPDPRAQRYLQIRDMLHELKESISTARRRLPCLLVHQVSREGTRAADKTGVLRMDHFAEGSEVERTADWAFGLYQSIEDRAVLMAKLQTLAARRADLKHWELHWNIRHGGFSVRREIELEVG